VGIPNVHYYIESNEYNFMVIDLLGLSLEDLFNNCGRRLSLKSVIMIAEQMVIKIIII
jgi:casein kinase 1